MSPVMTTMQAEIDYRRERLAHEFHTERHYRYHQRRRHRNRAKWSEVG
jgi:hypothetical protein